MKSLEQTIHKNLVYDSAQRICVLLKESPEILKEFKNRLINTLLI